MLNVKIKYSINYFLCADESSPKHNLNETFEINDDTLKLDSSFPLGADIKEQDVQPEELNNLTKMEGYSRTSTPKGMKFIGPCNK
jgi:hypothetical protein